MGFSLPPGTHPRRAFRPMLIAPGDEGGDYTICDEDFYARHADEDGDYPHNGSMSLDLAPETAANLLANPGQVETLDSGANG